MSDITWLEGDPPSEGWNAARRAATERFAAALTANPGRWAQWPFQPASTSAARAQASRITRGKIAAFRRGFEATAVGDTLYVRYIGELTE